MSGKTVTLKCKKCGSQKTVVLPHNPGTYKTPCSNSECGEYIIFKIGSKPKLPQRIAVCSGCKSKIAIPDDYTSAEFRCPRCGTHSAVNNLGNAPRPKPQAPAPAKPQGLQVAVEKITPQELERRKQAKAAAAATPPAPAPGERTMVIGHSHADAAPLHPRSLKPGSAPCDLVQKVMMGLREKRYSLIVGNNIIGRKDSAKPSDIEIEKDPSISRRSVNLEMRPAQSGFTYHLTVLHSLNPVLHNGNPLNQGDSVTMTPGDSIRLGDTTLWLTPSKKKK